jgi:orotidine-5'-phosphate decarboxylase
MQMTPFPDRLADAVRRVGNPLCVGLDPRWESLPLAIRERFPGDSLESVAGAFETFSLRILELIAGRVGIIKPQSAFFEACGPAGLKALQVVIRRAKELCLLVILDAKRGDIASTASAYADAAFAGTSIGGRQVPVWAADALTVNPYLGRDAVEPFIASARQVNGGLFVLVRTSNPGAGLFQDLDCGGMTLYRRVAAAVAEWNSDGLGECGFGDVGAVVGANHPRELAELRTELPNVWFLVPGYGAQGGSAADVAAAFRADGLGAVINSSRGVTFPFHPDDSKWDTTVSNALERASHELKAIQPDRLHSS